MTTRALSAENRTRMNRIGKSYSTSHDDGDRAVPTKVLLFLDGLLPTLRKEADADARHGESRHLTTCTPSLQGRPGSDASLMCLDRKPLGTVLRHPDSRDIQHTLLRKRYCYGLVVPCEGHDTPNAPVRGVSDHSGWNDPRPISADSPRCRAEISAYGSVSAAVS